MSRQFDHLPTLIISVCLLFTTSVLGNGPDNSVIIIGSFDARRLSNIFIWWQNFCDLPISNSLRTSYSWDKCVIVSRTKQWSNFKSISIENVGKMYRLGGHSSVEFSRIGQWFIWSPICVRESIKPSKWQDGESTRVFGLSETFRSMWSRGKLSAWSVTTEPVNRPS